MKRWEIVSLIIAGLLLIMLLAGLAVQSQFRHDGKATQIWIPVEWLTTTPTATSTPGWWDALPTPSFPTPSPEVTPTPEV